MVRWSDEEERALEDAIQKHGEGHWEYIRRDPQFSILLCVFGERTKSKKRV